MKKWIQRRIAVLLTGSLGLIAVLYRLDREA